MTDGKIRDYFSPLSRSGKRPRSNSSPASPEDRTSMLLSNMGNDEDKVGELTNGQLKSALRDVMSDLLDSKLSTLATKSDMINLSNQVSELRVECDSQNEQIIDLKRQNKLISDKLIDLESRSRRNNLIFKGLNWGDRTWDFRQVVVNFCNDKLGGGNQLCINRAHPLGKSKDTIIAHLPYDPDIAYIMSRVKDLKNTGYAVYRDFPQEIRVKRACLSAVRAEVERVTGQRWRMPLVHDHLTINKCRFSWEDGRLMAGTQDGVEKLRSMFKHDFTAFVAGLKNPPPRQPRNASEANAPQPTINGGRKSSSELESGAEASGGGGGETNERTSSSLATAATTQGGSSYSAALQGR